MRWALLFKLFLKRARSRIAINLTFEVQIHRHSQNLPFGLRGNKAGCGALLRGAFYIDAFS